MPPEKSTSIVLKDENVDEPMDSSDDDDSIMSRETVRRSTSNSKSPKSADDELEGQLKQTLCDIEQVDSLLLDLNERKRRLIKKYDRLKEQRMQIKSKALANENWHEESFPWSLEVRKILRDTFKLSDFRPQQIQTINAILSKHDVLLLAPTGGGKSLCYQLPALYSVGLTVVVSPLLALMQNQVWALQKLGVDAEMLEQQTDRAKNNAILKMMSEGKDHCNLKLLYVTPERLAKSKRFLTALQKAYFAGKLSMFAIDEVHCCSSWGHDFRPDYKFLGNLKTMFPEVPILGVTATATSKVIVDVQKMLNVQDCLVLRAPFNRPNLFYHLLEKPSEKEEVYKLLTHLTLERFRNRSGIIYTFSINDAEDLAKELTQRGVKARPYHARMVAERRDKILTNWLSGEIHTVVATIAFGMGIDKPDVRYVIHHTMSKSMENFYQESGRAGRDGERAECILLYRFADVSKITTMMFSERTGLKNAYGMVEYCIDGARCRRDLIAAHFTEVWSDLDCNAMCDYCFNRAKVRAPLLDIRPLAASLYTILENAAKTDSKLTSAKLIDAWFQKGAAINRCASVEVPTINRYFAEQVVAYLISNQYLKEDFHFTAYATISYVVRGTRNAALAKNPIEFQCARLHALPKWPTSLDSTANSSILPTATDDDASGDEVVFVSETQSERKRKKKKTKSKISERKSIRKSKSSEKRRKSSSRPAASEADSMCLANRMLDFQDEESTAGGVVMGEAGRLMPSPKVNSARKRRKLLIDEKDRVELRVGENDDLLLVQRSSDIIHIDSS